MLDRGKVIELSHLIQYMFTAHSSQELSLSRIRVDWGGIMGSVIKPL